MKAARRTPADVGREERRPEGARPADHRGAPDASHTRLSGRCGRPADELAHCIAHLHAGQRAAGLQLARSVELAPSDEASGSSTTPQLAWLRHAARGCAARGGGAGFRRGLEDPPVAQQAYTLTSVDAGRRADRPFRSRCGGGLRSPWTAALRRESRTTLLPHLDTPPAIHRTLSQLQCPRKLWGAGLAGDGNRSKKLDLYNVRGYDITHAWPTRARDRRATNATS